jgi:hypothetical protein
MAIAIQMPNGSDQNDIVEEGRLRKMPKDLMEIRVTALWQSELAALGKKIRLKYSSVDIRSGAKRPLHNRMSRLQKRPY